MSSSSSSSSSAAGERDALTASHCEYLAEETLITITPSVSHPQLKFLTGTFGPFEAGLTCIVPLWLAIHLRKRGKCAIQVPHWLNVQSLEELVRHETTERAFSALPFHYLEIGRLLLTNAAVDIPEPERVSALLQDLENIRMDRLRVGIWDLARNVQENVNVASTVISNVAALEILPVKEFLLKSLENFYWLRPPADEE